MDPDWRWVPTYASGSGLVSINEVAIPDCPAAFIGREARALANEYLTLGWARKATGGHGGDVSKWPARKVDAFIVLETESERKLEALRSAAGN